jgi:hypothetical protein
VAAAPDLSSGLESAGPLGVDMEILWEMDTGIVEISDYVAYELCIICVKHMVIMKKETSWVGRITLLKYLRNCLRLFFEKTTWGSTRQF